MEVFKLFFFKYQIFNHLLRAYELEPTLSVDSFNLRIHSELCLELGLLSQTLTCHTHSTDTN